MCLNDIRAEEIPRTSSLYIAVNERTKKKRLILIVNVLMLLQYLHLPNLNAASSVVWQNEKKKKYFDLRRERAAVAFISWTYFSDDLTGLFIYLFICTCKLKSFQF